MIMCCAFYGGECVYEVVCNTHMIMGCAFYGGECVCVCEVVCNTSVCKCSIIRNQVPPWLMATVQLQVFLLRFT